MKKMEVFMEYKQAFCQLTEKYTIAKEIYSFTILCPEIAAASVPGQFVHILPKGRTLRRPISICGIDKKKGTLRIVFEVRGEGTAEISEINKGENIDILAPLGKGFALSPDFRKVILIGGGIGTPPMLPLANYYGEKATVISGFRDASAVILQEDFKKSGAKTVLCTDDGSAGIKGFVTEPLAKLINEGDIDAVYACGPTPMLKNIAGMCNEKNIFCEVSLEERMGCGIGACLVCACKVHAENSGEHFAHVCKDGPVFNAKEVIF